jgi:hypothetical protein
MALRIPMNRKKTRTAEMQMPDSAAGERPSEFVSEDAEGVAGEEEDGVVETEVAFWTVAAPPTFTTEGWEVVVELIIPVEGGVVTVVVRGGVNAARVLSPCRYVSLEDSKYW